MNMSKMIVVGTIVLTLIDCAADDPYKRTKTGAAVGAAAGAVLGHIVDDGGGGALVGAAVGAITGAGVGHYMDNQQREFEKALAEEQGQHALEIERLNDETLKLSISNEVSFDFDRAKIKPAFYPTLDKLGAVINKYDRTVVHIVGHTDSVGTDVYNMELSQRRGESVFAYLQDRGVQRSRLRTEGRGEREPRATNDTAAGRQLNRRVEIYVKPVVQGQEQQAYEPPHYE